MTRPIKVDINCTTGEKTIIELTDEEIAQLEKDAVASQALLQEQEAKKQALVALKESAKTKLVAGEPLTEEEASLLVI